MKMSKRISVTILAILVLASVFATTMVFANPTTKAATPFKVVSVDAVRSGDFLGIVLTFDHNYAPQEVSTFGSMAMEDYVKVNGYTLTEITEIDDQNDPTNDFYNSSYCPGAELNKIAINFNDGPNCNIASFPINDPNLVVEILPGLAGLTDYETTTRQVFVRNNNAWSFREIAADMTAPTITIVRNDNAFGIQIQFDSAIVDGADVGLSDAVYSKLKFGDKTLAELMKEYDGINAGAYTSGGNRMDITLATGDTGCTDLDYSTITLAEGFITPNGKGVMNDMKFKLGSDNVTYEKVVAPSSQAPSSEATSTPASSQATSSNNIASEATESNAASNNNTGTPATGDFAVISLAVMGLAAAGTVIAIRKRK